MPVILPISWSSCKESKILFVTPSLHLPIIIPHKEAALISNIQRSCGPENWVR
jgi:hypothetical protein